MQQQMVGWQRALDASSGRASWQQTVVRKPVMPKVNVYGNGTTTGSSLQRSTNVRIHGLIHLRATILLVTFYGSKQRLWRSKRTSNPTLLRGLQNSQPNESHQTHITLTDLSRELVEHARCGAHSGYHRSNVKRAGPVPNPRQALMKCVFLIPT